MKKMKPYVNFPWWASKSMRPAYASNRIMWYAPLSRFFIGAAITVILILVFFSIRGSDIGNSEPGPWGSTSYEQSVNGVMGQCGRTFDFNPPRQFFGVINPDITTKSATGEMHIPLGPMMVPVFGYMSKNGLDTSKIRYEGTSVPSISETLRSMYSGIVIIWFDSQVSDSSRNEIEQYVRGNPGTVMIEWNQQSLGLDKTNTKPMPEGRHISISTWNISQSCLWFTKPAMDDFLTFAKNNFNKGTHPTEPPMAILDVKGRLQTIATMDY